MGFQFPLSLAPYDAVILPLLNRVELEELATRIFVESRGEGLAVLYDDRGRIGRRYARADEIGIPFAVTVDPESLENGSATIRYRDTAEQTRHPVKDIPGLLKR